MVTSPIPHRNSIVLAGRITAEPALRELSSGQTLARWRVAVTRPETEQRGRSKVDAVTCVSFDRTVQMTVRTWRLGDTVEVTGALRRRFWHGESGPVSTFEVEARDVGWLAAGSAVEETRTSAVPAGANPARNATDNRTSEAVAEPVSELAVGPAAEPARGPAVERTAGTTPSSPRSRSVNHSSSR